MSAPAILARGVRKSFGKLLVIDDLDLEVAAGRVHGFLGPNGAGKTTLIRILLGLLRPDKGEISILGRDLFTSRGEIMGRVGAIVENPVFFDYFSAYQNLYYLASLSAPTSRVRIEETLEIVGLSGVANRKVGEFSLGMRQRLGIAQALLPDNRLIFLDEPSNGLDPHGILDIRHLIKSLSAELGVTVFLSSHLLGEVEQTCDFVSIIHKGKKIREASVSELLAEDSLAELDTPAADRAVAIAAAMGGGLVRQFPAADTADGMRTVVLNIGGLGVSELNAALVAGGVPVHRITRRRRNLEEVFVELTK